MCSCKVQNVWICIYARRFYKKQLSEKWHTIRNNSGLLWHGAAAKAVFMSFLCPCLMNTSQLHCFTIIKETMFSHFVSRTSTKCWQHPACLEEKSGKRWWTSQHQLHHCFSQLCSTNLSVTTLCAYIWLRSNRSSPATDSPSTPSPLPDPAFQLAVEAKELVQGVCSLTVDDKGTQ